MLFICNKNYADDVRGMKLEKQWFTAALNCMTWGCHFTFLSLGFLICKIGSGLDDHPSWAYKPHFHYLSLPAPDIVRGALQVSVRFSQLTDTPPILPFEGPSKSIVVSIFILFQLPTRRDTFGSHKLEYFNCWLSVFVPWTSKVQWREWGVRSGDCPQGVYRSLGKTLEEQVRHLF